MNTLLVTLIVLKGVCLFVCWRAVSIAKKQKNNANADNHSNNNEEEQLNNLKEKAARLMEQNQILVKELHESKQIPTNKLN